MKTNKENQIHSRSAARYTRSIHPAVTDAWALEVNRPHTSVTPRQGIDFDRRELADGEVIGDEVTTNVFPFSFRP